MVKHKVILHCDVNGPQSPSCKGFTKAPEGRKYRKKSAGAPDPSEKRSLHFSETHPACTELTAVRCCSCIMGNVYESLF